MANSASMRIVKGLTPERSHLKNVAKSVKVAGMPKVPRHVGAPKVPKAPRC